MKNCNLSHLQGNRLDRCFEWFQGKSISYAQRINHSLVTLLFFIIDMMVQFRKSLLYVCTNFSTSLIAKLCSNQLICGNLFGIPPRTSSS